MFDHLIAFSIRNRLFVVVVAAVLLVWGGLVAARLPVDVFPDLNRPTVTILAEAGGLAPEEVEVLVARPIESSMNGAPGVERVRSQAAAGLGVVWVEFDWDVDIYRARQQVQERLAQVETQLPEGIVPTLGPVSSIMGEILLVGLSSPEGTVPGPTLRTLADWTVRPRLLSIPGVAQVVSIGGGVEQIEVELRPDALALHGVTLEEARLAVERAQGASTGGFVDRKAQEYLVRNLARTADPERIADTPVRTMGEEPVRLHQVAAVHTGIGTPRGDAGVNGHAAVILSVHKQPGADTLALTEAVDAALREVGGALPEGAEVTVLFRQADFIDAAIGNVEEALRDGAILVVGVLVLFLLNARTTAITLTAIPLSMVVAALVLQAFGMTVNTMTLGGLAVAIGELVDDAIVDVENVFRRLRQNAELSSPRPFSEVVLAASSEVRSSIVFSTLLVILVFVPLFALSGIEGRLFLPLGVAYITAILASMAVSLTVTPALCRFLLPKAVNDKERGDGWVVRHLKAVDRRLLDWALPRPYAILTATGLLVLLAAGSLPFLGKSFLPEFHEGSATISVLATPGVSLAESSHLARLAERLVLEVPEVTSVGRRTGRAEMDEHAEGVHYTEIDVDFAEEGRPRPEVLQDIRSRLAALSGLSVGLGQPISHRLDHLMSGVRAAIAIKVFGPDLGALRETAARIEERLKTVPGAVDVQTERQVLIPQIQIDVDRDAAARFGLAAGEVTEVLGMALGGVTTGEVLEGLRTIDVVLRFEPSARLDPAAIEETPLVLADGRVIRIGQIARVVTGTGPNQVLHENGQRRIVVSANAAGRDLGSVVRDIETALEELALPAGTYVTLGGQFESQRQATRRIALLSLISLVGMVVVIHAYFRSIALVLQVLVNVPLALIGAVGALWVSGAELSVATLVGFVTLSGIATRNTILLLTHYVHLVKEEGERFGPEMIVRGSLERLVPVSMTALCAGLALIPLALAGGEPGKEILTPVAQVILGGLVTSTLLDLIVTPTLFLRFGENALRRLVSPTESL